MRAAIAQCQARQSLQQLNVTQTGTRLQYEVLQGWQLSQKLRPAYMSEADRLHYARDNVHSLCEVLRDINTNCDSPTEQRKRNASRHNADTKDFQVLRYA